MIPIFMMVAILNSFHFSLLCQISVVKMGLYILIVMLLHLFQFKITLIRLVAHSLNPENTAGGLNYRCQGLTSRLSLKSFLVKV